MKRINTRFNHLVENPRSRRGLKKAYDAEGRILLRAKREAADRRNCSTCNA